MGEGRPIDPKGKLIRAMEAHPDAQISTDVGMSMISGWGNLVDVVWHPEHNTLELIFD